MLKHTFLLAIVSLVRLSMLVICILTLGWLDFCLFLNWNCHFVINFLKSNYIIKRKSLSYFKSKCLIQILLQVERLLKKSQTFAKDCIPKCEVDFTKSQNLLGVFKIIHLQFENQRLSFLPLVVIWHHFIKCQLILKVLHFMVFSLTMRKQY